METNFQGKKIPTENECKYKCLSLTMLDTFGRV